MNATPNTPSIAADEYTTRLAAEYLSSFGGIPRHRPIDMSSFCLESIPVDNQFAEQTPVVLTTDATVRPQRGAR